MSRPVCNMVWMTSSSETFVRAVFQQGEGAEFEGLSAAMPLRSMQGICTNPPTGSAVRAQMVFHRHFGGVFHLFGRAADDFGVCARRHGTGDADFALAADVCAGDGGRWFS